MGSPEFVEIAYVGKSPSAHVPAFDRDFKRGEPVKVNKTRDGQAIDALIARGDFKKVEPPKPVPAPKAEEKK